MKKPSVVHLMDESRQVYGLLIPSNGFKRSHFPRIVASVLGVGMGMAGLYIALREGTLQFLFTPQAVKQNGSSEVVYYVAGLRNLGNNCFLNVILQALASCRCFTSSLQNILLEYDKAKAEELPLTVALALLLEDLCAVQERRNVLNPRRVMDSLSLYVSNFQLTRQQDAAEALTHLLSSLGDEISQCYVPNDPGLSNISVLPSRTYMTKRNGQEEYERWWKSFVGPFDGTIGSTLTCKTCSNMLSMDVDFFYCLPLSPGLQRGLDIMYGPTVEDCLQRFTAVEHVENYRCGRCWHLGALRYLCFQKDHDESKKRMLSECVNVDSCDCKNLFHEEEITWSGFSDAVKQLTIVRRPEILCLHLQRASINETGELIKIQAHISFPFTLDLFPFMQVAKTLCMQTVDDTKKQGWQQQWQVPVRHLPLETQRIMGLNKIFGEDVSLEVPRKKLGSSALDLSVDPPLDTRVTNCSGEAVLENEMAPYDLGSAQLALTNKVEISEPQSLISRRQCLYQLCSVIEHYGRPGSGHYAVYRRLSVKSDAENSAKLSDEHQWFYISDGVVVKVSEEEVLSAEASLLFYEGI